MHAAPHLSRAPRGTGGPPGLRPDCFLLLAWIAALCSGVRSRPELLEKNVGAGLSTTQPTATLRQLLFSTEVKTNKNLRNHCLFEF